LAETTGSDFDGADHRRASRLTLLAVIAVSSAFQYRRPGPAPSCDQVAPVDASAGAIAVRERARAASPTTKLRMPTTPPPTRLLRCCGCHPLRGMGRKAH